MNANVKKVAIAAITATTFAIISVAMLGNANAAGAKKSSPSAAPPPPPSWGYLATPPRVMDFALAQSTSLEWPYYTQQIFDYCDYRNCTLQLRNGSWVPVWYGPPN